MTQDTSDKDGDDPHKAVHLSPFATAFFIGFLIGIVIFSVSVNSWGWFTLIPLYMAYKLIKAK
ncbi:MAG: hypothetical protein AAGH19_02790 [Pseudomonadota bacterium]